MSETEFAMMSEWMFNGNINDFVKANPKEDRLGLVGFRSEFYCRRFVDVHTTL